LTLSFYLVCLHIVYFRFREKLFTATINLANQKAEIINPSLSMLYNNPLKIRCQLLQVCQSVLFPNRYFHIVSVQVLLLTYDKSFPILPLSKSKVPSIERNGKPYDTYLFCHRRCNSFRSSAYNLLDRLPGPASG
jgi:hypothetical protein